MFNFHAIAAVDEALAALGQRSIVFTTEMAGLLDIIKSRLTINEVDIEVEIDLQIHSINDPVAKVSAHSAGVADSVVATSKMADFLLDIRTALANG